MDIQKNRAREIIIQKVAEFIGREATNQSLITVTDLALSDDSKEAVILISVLPEKEENPALSFVRHHLNDIRSYVKNNTKLRSIPYFRAELDYGEKNRQRIDEIIEETNQ